MSPRVRDTRERIKACLEEWFFFEQCSVERCGLCLSVVFSLNGAVAELSRDESAGQAHLIVDTIRNVIRGGGDCADGGL